LHYREGNGGIIHEAPVMPLRRNFSPEDKIIRCFEILRLNEGFDAPISRDAEESFDHRLLGTASNDFCAGSIPKNQAQRIDEDGFPCPSFARDDIQAAFEFDLDLFNEGVILYEEGFQHGFVLLVKECTEKKWNFNVFPAAERS